MPRAGGTYRIEKKGAKPKLVRPPTKDHPQGARARDGEGRPLDDGGRPLPVPGKDAAVGKEE